MPKESAENSLVHSARGQRELYEHPGHLIRRLNQISVSIFLTEAKEYDLTHIQYASLTVIAANAGIDQSSLGRLVAIDRQTVSTVVRRLCEKGLVRREQKDGRSGALFITGSARALIKVLRARLPVVDQILLAPLPPEEQAIFMELLTKLVNGNNSRSRAPLHEPDEPRNGPKKAENTSPEDVLS